jgi:hypothetical protein
MAHRDAAGGRPHIIPELRSNIRDEEIAWGLVEFTCGSLKSNLSRYHASAFAKATA